MKRIIYATATKFIAVVLALACIMLAFAAVIDAIADVRTGERYIYGFEESFEQSSYLAGLLREPEGSVYSAYVVFENDGTTTLDENIATNLVRLPNSDKINYFVSVNGKVYTNCNAATAQDILRDGYYLLSERDADGNTNHSTDIQAVEYQPYFLDSIYSINKTDEITVAASVKKELVRDLEETWNRQADCVKSVFTRTFAFALAALLLIAYLIAVCGRRGDGEQQLVWIDRIWTELHLGVIAASGVGAACVIAIVLDEFFSNRLPEYMTSGAVLAAAGAGALLILTSTLSIVRKIKCGKFIEGSMICRIVRWLWRLCVRIARGAWRRLKSFFKALSGVVTRKTDVILIAVLLVYTGIIGACGILLPSNNMALISAVVMFGAACFFVVYRARDIEEIKRGANQIRGGNLSYKIPELRSEDLRALAANINEIGMGLDESVSAKLKAERLKTELITNVSHDLKTPLTSIISYTQLLAGMQDLPEQAQDYIRIIAQKSERLKNLTQDLFDISKVQSGNEELVLERLDVSLLINQALGEHDSDIRQSRLTFCTDIEKELYISADGRKMSRVIGNLISNILKYAMQNTRVFISALERDRRVIIEMKNVASYPMDFDADEIMGRFVRGDKSRTVDGNGLGLAIARSYTQACGGEFNVITDGDLFKAIIVFNKL